MICWSFRTCGVFACDSVVGASWWERPTAPFLLGLCWLLRPSVLLCVLVALCFYLLISLPVNVWAEGCKKLNRKSVGPPEVAPKILRIASQITEETVIHIQQQNPSFVSNERYCCKDRKASLKEENTKNARSGEGSLHRWSRACSTRCVCRSPTGCHLPVSSLLLLVCLGVCVCSLCVLCVEIKALLGVFCCERAGQICHRGQTTQLERAMGGIRLRYCGQAETKTTLTSVSCGSKYQKSESGVLGELYRSSSWRVRV